MDGFWSSWGPRDDRSGRGRFTLESWVSNLLLVLGALCCLNVGMIEAQSRSFGLEPLRRPRQRTARIRHLLDMQNPDGLELKRDRDWDVLELSGDGFNPLAVRHGLYDVKPHNHVYEQTHPHTHVLEDGTIINHEHPHKHVYIHYGEDDSRWEQQTRIQGARPRGSLSHHESPGES